MQSDPNIGREIAGAFRLLERIGSGAMGVVYRAEEPALERVVAVKLLHPALARHREAISRFRREARILAKLSHPNIVRVFRVARVDDDPFFIAMEHVDGDDLAKLVSALGPVPQARALAIAIDVAHALHHAHEAGVIHRDLKPENVVVCRGSGAPKIVDFGLAKIAEGAGVLRTSLHTRQGALLGTPAFMAPEQVQGAKLDRRADVYALAAVLYFAISGKLPFEAATLIEYARLQASEPPLPLGERAPGAGVLLDLERVVARALSRDPAGRPATAAAFADELGRLAPQAAGRAVAVDEGRREPLPSYLGEVHATNAPALDLLRNAARIAADAVQDGSDRDARTKRRASALEAIFAVETALLARLERALGDGDRWARWRRLLPPPGRGNLAYLHKVLADQAQPSLAVLARCLSPTARASHPDLVAELQQVLGVPEGLELDLLRIGELRILLAHRGARRLAGCTVPSELGGWVERVGEGDRVDFDVHSVAVRRLEWLAACVLERRLRPQGV